MGNRKAGTFTMTYIKNTQQMNEWIRCKQDPYYFIDKYVKIPHPVAGEIPFHLYPFQRSLIWAYLTYRYSVCLKPRQMGVSMLVAAFALWVAIFHDHQNILIITIKQVVARAMLRRIKYMYINLPEFLKMELANGAKNSIGTSDRIAFANHSEIAVAGSTDDAGRSDALSLLIMDEVAFQPHASTTWGAAQQTLATGGRAILLSTAFGVGNFFHTTYTDALQNQTSSGFKALRLKWQMHPDRDKAWHDEQRLLLGAKRMAQEIDCNFLQSGFNVFEIAKIRAIDDRIKEHPPIEKRMGDKIWIFKKPRKDETYWIGADIATGKARDYSAFSIMNGHGVEYACGKMKMGVREFAYLMMSMGQEYNWAWLAPENNAIGQGTVATIQEQGYDNLYNEVSRILDLEDYSRNGLALPEESMTYGWFTTGKSRHEMISRMDDDLSDDTIELNNPFFVNEAYTFVYNEANKPIALGKDKGKGGIRTSGMYEDEDSNSVVYTDDSIIAGCITNSVRSEPTRFRGPLPIRAGV